MEVVAPRPADDWNKSYKEECVRPGTPLTPEDGVRITGRYIDYYNSARLHSAIGYVTPRAFLEGRQRAIGEERDRKLEQARAERQKMRREGVPYEPPPKNMEVISDSTAGQSPPGALQ